MISKEEVVDALTVLLKITMDYISKWKDETAHKSKKESK